jgi:hypothetical protein
MLTDAEYKETIIKAELCGMTLGQWFREAAISREIKIIPAINRQTAANVSRIGNLINQSIQMVKKGELKGLPIMLIDELMTELKILRKELLG